jgi:hypothetical protein
MEAKAIVTSDILHDTNCYLIVMNNLWYNEFNLFTFREAPKNIMHSCVIKE